MGRFAALGTVTQRRCPYFTQAFALHSCLLKLLDRRSLTDGSACLGVSEHLLDQAHPTFRSMAYVESRKSPSCFSSKCIYLMLHDDVHILKKNCKFEIVGHVAF